MRKQWGENAKKNGSKEEIVGLEYNDKITEE